jgi:hypothetical protein
MWLKASAITSVYVYKFFAQCDVKVGDCQLVKNSLVPFVIEGPNFNQENCRVISRQSYRSLFNDADRLERRA